jgi:hypothetical protein
MSWWLQVILALVLLAVGGLLVPLLLQLRRTAAAVQALAESARADLDLITADVHHLRARVDGLADQATGCLELPISLARMAGTASRAFETFLNPRTLAWVAPLLTGFKIALKFLRRPKKSAASEEESHE